jgi:hypothetical protein
MNATNTITKLAAALVAAQAELENAHKNSTNPHFRSKYADLPEVIDTVKPVLAKYGIAVVQMPGFEDGVVTLETLLIHESGEWLSGVSGAPAQKQDPQGVGSAITYLRRYALAAACNIAQEDDDGNAASKPRSDSPYVQVKKDVVDTRDGEVIPFVSKMPSGNALIGTLQRLVAEFVDPGVEMSKDDMRAVNAAAKLVDDPAAPADRVVKAVDKLRALLDKYKPGSPFENEVRDQNLDLAGTNV